MSSTTSNTLLEPLSVNQRDAARLLGVTGRTIRDWEKKGLIKGRKVNGGVRLYSYAKLKKLAGAND